jgi:hypothetical protein
LLTAVLLHRRMLEATLAHRIKPLKGLRGSEGAQATDRLGGMHATPPVTD